MATTNSQSPLFEMHKFFMPTMPTQPPTSSSPLPAGSHPHQFFFPHPHQPHHPPPDPPRKESPNPNSHCNPAVLCNPHAQLSVSYPTFSVQPQFQFQQQNSQRCNNARSGAELMALLLPPSQQYNPEFYHRSNVGGAHGAPVRMIASKKPQGRRVIGDHVVYDVDVRLPGEMQPQLEVTPITKYISDPQLCLGRQIAVNKSYICYGLKQGNIRVLNINTALRSLFRTQSQRITDMVFFAEDVHILASVGVDGRVNVWKIYEGPDEEEKAQITGNTVIAIQITGEGEIRNPRVCWHSYKQEILVVGVGKHVLSINSNKVGKGEAFSSDDPLQCPIENLIEGVQLVGRHDGEVTDLSMCQWMTSRLISASMDGTIKIWEDLKPSPLVVLSPYGGQPVYSAVFLTATSRPDHIILVTVGPQNREVKIWASNSDEGWILPSDTNSLVCKQTLELKCSADFQVEEAFFNQIVTLPQFGLLLFANAKRSAIYVVHIDYGPNPAAARMDYISEYTVTMPILSLTGTSDECNGQCVAQIYCVQTQAIQQYTLELSQCLQLALDSVGSDKLELAISNGLISAEELDNLDTVGSKFSEISMTSSPNDVTTTQNILFLHNESNPLPSVPSEMCDAGIICLPSPPFTPRPKVSPEFFDISVLPKFEGGGSSSSDLNKAVVDYFVDQKINSIVDSNLRGEERNATQVDSLVMLQNPVSLQPIAHLMTPDEILVGIPSSELINKQRGKFDGCIQDVVVHNNIGNSELEVQVVGEPRPIENGVGFLGENKNVAFQNKELFVCSKSLDLGIEVNTKFFSQSNGTHTPEDIQKGSAAVAMFPVHPYLAGGEEVKDSDIDVTGKFSESVVASGIRPVATPNTKGKKQKGKISLASELYAPSPVAFNPTDFNHDSSGTSGALVDVTFPQVVANQEVLNQLVNGQKDMQKQITTMIVSSLIKECARMEIVLGNNFEKAIRSNNDALWARFQEDSMKNEKLIRERTQQISNSISNIVNKDLTTMLEKTVKRDLASIGPSVVRQLSPIIEKTLSSAIAEFFQRGVGDKVVNQLEKSVNSKLEATVARQIQMQFQTSGRQALQDCLKASLEASVIPAFEVSCKTMFDQVDAAFQKGMAEHTHVAQQHLESSHSPLVLTLQDTINSASTLTQTLSGELADGQRKLLALVAAGSNSNASIPLIPQLNCGPLVVHHEKVDKLLDPTKELSRLIAEHRYEEAFTMALQRSDLSIVSWLCCQVDLRGILSMASIPLSQGVLLSLLQQLACDIKKDMPRKLSWMTDVAAAINPTDQMIVVHVRPIFEQVYQILHHQRSSSSATGAELSTIRILMHVINSMLVACR